MYDVVTIGSTVKDSFWYTDFETVSSDAAPSGKAIAIPLGEKFGAEKVVTSLGGNAANAAVTFSRQGHSTALFTKVGNDVVAKELVQELKKEKVSTDLVEYSNDKNTAESILLLQDGERSIITYHGAINEFTLEHVALEQLHAQWWYVSLPGDSYKLFDRLLVYAREHNIKVAYNPSFKHLQGEGRNDLLKHLEDVSLLVLNEGEAAALTGISFEKEQEVFEKLDVLVPGIVAVTNGPKGVTVSDGAHIYKAGIFKEQHIEDRTGAGDAFGSGFVAGLLQTEEECKKGVCNSDNITHAIRLASANATSVIEQVGSTPGTLTKEAFETNPRWKELDITIM